jgi:TfoX/Sxy family transcriptional regulator of competence genes
MAYDEFLAERIQRIFDEKRVPCFGKKMFGGICFLVNEKMCVGVIKNQLMVRIDPEIHEGKALKPGVRPMDFSGKEMKGFFYVAPEYIDMDDDLESWINLALDFNPRAKASKK